jgi:hypothetical protein
MTLDFTIQKYEDLCIALTEKKVYTVQSFLTQKPKTDFVILRHDIDRKTANSLKISKLENKYNLYSSYYFRVNNSIDTTLIKQIKDLGHEVGYHYEVLSKTHGDYKKAHSLFNKELSLLRNTCEINTICMHGSPASKFNNLEIWDKNDFKNYDILGDALLSISNVHYFTDSGRSWDRKNNLRDHLPGEILPIKIIKNTDQLIDKILEDKNNYYITTHPEHWSSNYLEYIINYSRSIIYNTGKYIIHSIIK